MSAPVPAPRTPVPYVRSADEIKADLAAYNVRATRQRDLLIGSLHMLDAINHRRDVLLEQLAAALTAEQQATSG